jgi:hypothetical protein
MGFHGGNMQKEGVAEKRVIHIPLKRRDITTNVCKQSPTNTDAFKCVRQLMRHYLIAKI